MALSREASQTLAQLSHTSTDLTAEYLRDTSNRAARVKARTAAQNLFLELQDGDDAYGYLFEQAASNNVLRFLLSIGGVKAIPTNRAISATDLAAKLGCEQTFIIRLMRMVVASGLFAEPEQDTYAHTKRSIVLLDPGYQAYFEMDIDDFFHGKDAVFPYCLEYYQSHKMQSPDDPKRNPYTAAQGMDGHDWHEITARTPEKLERFNAAMTAKWNQAPMLGTYPFDTLVEASQEAEDSGRVFVVDVGAAIGAAMKELREAIPQLKGRIVVQDQERVIKAIPEGFLPSSIEPMVHDFYSPQPVKGAKVYSIRRVLHDWPDAQCITILKRLADAMAEDSILLIAEMLVPERVQREDTYVYTLDLVMFMFAGRERSAVDWKKLFDESGLELIKIWPSEVGSFAMMEGRKKRT